jgi:hypothetical protein
MVAYGLPSPSAVQSQRVRAPSCLVHQIASSLSSLRKLVRPPSPRRGHVRAAACHDAPAARAAGRSGRRGCGRHVLRSELALGDVARAGAAGGCARAGAAARGGGARPRRRKEVRHSAAQRNACSVLTRLPRAAWRRLHEHFDSIQRISDTTTLPSLLPALRERLYRLVDVDTLTARLIAARGAEALPPAEKYAAWEELAVLSACPVVDCAAKRAALRRESCRSGARPNRALLAQALRARCLRRGACACWTCCCACSSTCWAATCTSAARWRAWKHSRARRSRPARPCRDAQRRCRQHRSTATSRSPTTSPKKAWRPWCRASSLHAAECSPGACCALSPCFHDPVHLTS